jgi:uncharacterized DUF497 family protein
LVAKDWALSGSAIFDLKTPALSPVASQASRPLPKLRQRRSLVIVKYKFDPAKDHVNQDKHGVSLALAELVFAGPHICHRRSLRLRRNKIKSLSDLSAVVFSFAFTRIVARRGE